MIKLNKKLFPLDLQDYGLTIVESLPNNFESMLTLIIRVGVRKSTHYGDKFHVFARENPSNLAYAGVALGFHTDLPYYDYNPGVRSGIVQD